MRFTYVTILLFYLMFNSVDGQEHSIVPDLVLVNSRLPNWINFWKECNSDFDLAHFTKRDVVLQRVKCLYSYLSISTFDTVDSLFFIFSDDSSAFLDIYSYHYGVELKRGRLRAQLEPDTKVSVVDRKLKQCFEILYAGSSTSYDDALWITPTRFLLVGHDEISEDLALPFCYVYDVVTHEAVLYESRFGCSNGNKRYFRIKYPMIVFPSDKQ